ncbi:MCM domain-containing protein 2 [Trichoplax sp. H2]|nr:MCM domain-containing protein 2 [Trichoplax sp. H2]|eukprot:RDD45931.1 MCM domain-containing protein 2 [Trichoplax sp. H2]
MDSSTNLTLHQWLFLWIAEDKNLLSEIKCQCQHYTFSNAVENGLFRFVIEFDPMEVVDFNAILGNFILNNHPTVVTKVFKQVFFTLFNALGWLPNLQIEDQVYIILRPLCLPALPQYNLNTSAEITNSKYKGNYVMVTGQVTGIMSMTKYTTEPFLEDF